MLCEICGKAYAPPLTEQLTAALERGAQRHQRCGSTLTLCPQSYALSPNCEDQVTARMRRRWPRGPTLCTAGRCEAPSVVQTSSCRSTLVGAQMRPSDVDACGAEREVTGARMLFGCAGSRWCSSWRLTGRR